jgi:hypothetical protein
MPLPLPGWGACTWIRALDKSPSAVSKYISAARKKVLSQDYIFLTVWKNIGKKSIGKKSSGISNKRITHRDLHLDKLYDEDGPVDYDSSRP